MVAAIGTDRAIAADAVCMVGYTPSPAPVRAQASTPADLREESAQCWAIPWVVTVVASMAGLNVLLARVWLMLGRLRIAVLNETLLSVVPEITMVTCDVDPRQRPESTVPGWGGQATGVGI
jgi:hypothetical protein